MKRFLVISVILITAGFLYGGNLKNYIFTPKSTMTAEPAFSGEVLVSSLLFENFSGNYLVTKTDDPTEVKRFFNLELKKRFIKAGVKIFDYGIVNSFRYSRDSRSQEGTLKVSSVNDGDFLFYNINQLKEVNTVLGGDIEYFQFDKSFNSSFIVLTLKYYNRDSGYNYWLSTITGRVDEVMDYIVKSLQFKKTGE